MTASIPRELRHVDRPVDASAWADLIGRARMCRALAVSPVDAKRAVDALRGSGVAVWSVTGYPLGLNKPTLKAIEATSLAKEGVDAIEITPSPAAFRANDLEALRQELLEIARGARAARPAVGLHLRLEVGWLGETTSIEALAQTALRGACDGIVLDGDESLALEQLRQVPRTLPLARRIILAEGYALSAEGSALSAEDATLPESVQAMGAIVMVTSRA